VLFNERFIITSGAKKNIYFGGGCGGLVSVIYLSQKSDAAPFASQSFLNNQPGLSFVSTELRLDF
jgi:hypothetical protein